MNKKILPRKVLKFYLSLTILFLVTFLFIPFTRNLFSPNEDRNENEIVLSNHLKPKNIYKNTENESMIQNGDFYTEIVEVLLSDVSGKFSVKIHDKTKNFDILIFQKEFGSNRSELIHETLIRDSDLDSDDIFVLTLSDRFRPNSDILIIVREVLGVYLNYATMKTAPAPTVGVKKNYLLKDAASFDWNYDGESVLNDLNYIKVTFLNSDTNEIVYIDIKYSSELDDEKEGKLFYSNLDRYTNVSIEFSYGLIHDTKEYNFKFDPDIGYIKPDIINIEENISSDTKSTFDFELFDPGNIISQNDNFYAKISVRSAAPDSPPKFIKIEDSEESNTDEEYAYWNKKYVPDSKEGAFTIKNMKPSTEYEISLVIVKRYFPKNNVLILVSDSLFLKTNPIIDKSVNSKMNSVKIEEIEDSSKWFFDITFTIKNDDFKIDENSNIDFYILDEEKNIISKTYLNHAETLNNERSYKFMGSDLMNNGEELLELFSYLSIGKFENGEEFISEGKLSEYQKPSDSFFSSNSSIEINLNTNTLIVNDNFYYESNFVKPLNFSHTIYENNSGISLKSNPKLLRSKSNSNYALSSVFLIDDFNFPPEQTEFEFSTSILVDFEINGFDGIFNFYDSDFYLNDEIVLIDETYTNTNKVVIVLIPIVFFSIFSLVFVGTKFVRKGK